MNHVVRRGGAACGAREPAASCCVRACPVGSVAAYPRVLAKLMHRVEASKARGRPGGNWTGISPGSGVGASGTSRRIDLPTTIDRDIGGYRIHSHTRRISHVCNVRGLDLWSLVYALDRP